jgi:hypothetical protein
MAERETESRTSPRPETEAPIRSASLASRFRARIGATKYSRLLAKARARLNAYRKNRVLNVNTVKGFVLEATASELPQVQRAMSRARAAAAAMGVDPHTIRLTTDVTDVVRGPGGRGGGRGELSDGVIYGLRRRDASRPRPRADEAAVPGVDEIVVFAFVETKVGGQAGKLAVESGEWGQVERTRARLETGDVTIDGVPYPSKNIFLPADFGRRLQVVGVVPRRHPPEQVSRLREDLAGRRSRDAPHGDPQGRDAVIAESYLSDAEAYQISEHIMESLAQSQAATATSTVSPNDRAVSRSRRGTSRSSAPSPPPEPAVEETPEPPSTRRRP